MTKEEGKVYRDRWELVDRCFAAVYPVVPSREHRYLVCIGSNFEREKNMDLARKKLQRLFPSICFLSEMLTEPIALDAADWFLNQLAIFYSTKEEAEIAAALKTMERESGRLPEEKKRGIIRLDIDLLLCDDRILKSEDWERDYVCASLHAFSSSFKPNIS